MCFLSPLWPPSFTEGQAPRRRWAEERGQAGWHLSCRAPLTPARAGTILEGPAVRAAAADGPPTNVPATSCTEPLDAGLGLQGVLRVVPCRGGGGEGPLTPGRRPGPPGDATGGPLQRWWWRRPTDPWSRPAPASLLLKPQPPQIRPAHHQAAEATGPGAWHRPGPRGTPMAQPPPAPRPPSWCPPLPGRGPP